ncbi:MAG TPA: hypothetical protein VGR87_16120 [Candidatus Limnocylindria bacterium]|jgi:hypothetical protein|nr:hypothetical protein [Candidatus Limnocylindria bacterium]
MPAPAPPPALRPLGIGDVVDRVFRLYRDRALGLFLLSAIPFILFIVGYIALTVYLVLSIRPFATSLATAANADPLTLFNNEGFLEFIGAAFAYLIALSLLGLVVGSVIAGAVVDAAAAAHLGRPKGVGASLGVGLRSAPRIFLTGLIASLALFIVWLFFAIVGGFIENALAGFAFFLAYVFAISYLEASWFIAPAVAAIERHGPISSLRRSWQLSGGFRWRIVALGILLFVLFIVLFIFMAFVLTLVAASSRVAGAIATFVVLFAMIPSWLPLFFGTMTVLYYDLRVRKEGFDLQLAAEAMPRA